MHPNYYEDEKWKKHDKTSQEIAKDKAPKH